MPYSIIDHTADLGLRIEARDLPGLYEAAAAALGEQLVEVSQSEGLERRCLTVGGEDWADLMVNWLRELLAFWHLEGQVARAARCHELSPYTLTADVDLLGFDPAAHSPHHEIKAVTYHQLDVSPTADGWQATVIFDL